MKVENMVCSLSQAKTLKNLGVNCKTLLGYIEIPENGISSPFFWKDKRHALLNTDIIMFAGNGERKWYAPNVSELMILLPDYLPHVGNLEIGKAGTDHVYPDNPVAKWWYNVSFWTWEVKETKSSDTYLEKKSLHLQQADTLAKALCSMLIFLIQGNFVSVTDINKRFNETD